MARFEQAEVPAIKGVDALNIPFLGHHHDAAIHKIERYIGIPLHNAANSG
jgi:hypothetical protein